MPKISALPSLTTPASDDKLVILDESTGATKKISVGDLTGTPEFGWVSTTETWVYASWSATTRIGVLTVPTDATQTYSPGMRIRIEQATGGTKYGIIHAVSSTTLTIFFPDGTTLNNEAVTLPYFSASKVPFGFDADPSKWTLQLTSTTDRSTTSQTFVSLTDALVHGVGAWKVSLQIYLRLNLSANVDRNAIAILSSDASTATDSELIVGTGIGSSTGLDSYSQLYCEKYVIKAAQTTWTLMGRINGSSSELLTFGASTAPTIIRALSGYL